MDLDLDLPLATTAIEQPPLSQPFPLSPRAPSSSLHKSLIVSEDGIVQLPVSSDGEEDLSDNETSRQLEGFMASQRVAKVVADKENSKEREDSSPAETEPSPPPSPSLRSSQKRRNESLAQDDGSSPAEASTSDVTLSSSSLQPPSKKARPNSSAPRPKPIPPRSASQSSRTETPTALASQTQVKYQKHHTHWVSDGNVIVRISNVQFKLFKSVLSKQSKWFSDTFEEMDGRQPQDQYIGYPVYVLDGLVSLKDFEKLLDAMDGAITYVHDPPPFPVLASIIRASTALDFMHFKRYSRRLLEDKWAVPAALRPSKPDAKKENQKEKRNDQVKDGDDSGEDDDDEDPDIDVGSLVDPISYPHTSILLARDCDIPSILPRAMYELVASEEFGLNEVRTQGLNSSKHEVIDVDADDEEVEDEDEEKKDKDGKKHRPKLPEDIYHRLIRAREKLTTLWMTHIVVPPDVQHSDDTSDEDEGKDDGSSDSEGSDSDCPAADRGRDLQIYTYGVLTPRGNIDSLFVDFRYDPITGVKYIMELDWRSRGYCENCVRERKKAWINMIKSWWRIFEETINA
ncbi:hypothetical protein VKT23_000231 [Stygiomarasmius scandens]|uniref:BTB domain-containing protein n=1 Tax=Marasmiellus scandens TaxID=2682957 RepID=A0ABR1K9H4_9AGAR